MRLVCRSLLWLPSLPNLFGEWLGVRGRSCLFESEDKLNSHSRLKHRAGVVAQNPAAARRQIESAIDDRLDALGSLTPQPLSLNKLKERGASVDRFCRSFS